MLAINSPSERNDKESHCYWQEFTINFVTKVTSISFVYQQEMLHKETGKE